MIMMRIALAFCPRTFRMQYGSDILRDFKVAPTAAEVLNIFMTGLSLRLQSFVNDILTSLRSLWFTPALSLVSILAITLGLGANLTSAALADHLLLHALPYDQPQQILLAQNQGGGIAYPDANKLALSIRRYADVGISQSDSRIYTGDGISETIRGAIVSTNYFEVLRVHPALGEYFTEHGHPQQDIVVSYDFWSKALHGNAVLGKTIRLDGSSFNIIGIASKTFLGLPEFDVDTAYWIAVDKLKPEEVSKDNKNYAMILRVHDGLNAKSASEEARIALSRIIGGTNSHGSCCATITSASNVLVNAIEPVILLLYSATLIVLFIACINVAGLQFTRNISRAASLATREALGASPSRITYELTVDIAIITIIGCVLGLGLSRLILLAASKTVPSLDHVDFSGQLALYSLALVILCTTIMAAIPSVSQRRSNIAEAIKGTGRGNISRGNKMLLGILLVSEIALAAMLIIASSLIVRSFFGLSLEPFGFTPEKVFVAEIHQPASQQDADNSDVTSRRIGTSMLAELSENSAIQNIALASQIPFSCCNSQRFSIPNGAQNFMALFSTISPAYFSTMKIPMILGREFASNDSLGASNVAIVDKKFAERYFGTLNVLGRTIDSGQHYKIIGVVSSVRESIGEPPRPMVYLAFAQDPRLKYFVIESNASVSALHHAFEGALKHATETVAIPEIYPMQQLISMRMQPPLVGTWIVVAFASLALLLSLAGIYTMTAFSVENRRQEYGLRKAVGASDGRIVFEAVSTILPQAIAGIVLGAVLAVLLSHVLVSILRLEDASSLFIYATTCFVFLFCTVLAALVPAARAATISPAIALRGE